MNIRWSTLPFAALTTATLYAVLKLRVDVFVVEQQCAYGELDGQDDTALHVLGLLDGTILAYARVLAPLADGVPHIGRVVVDPRYRGKGLGVAVMQEALRAAREAFGVCDVAVSAQAHLQRFYEDLGFKRTSDVYDWDGIPHVDMRLSAAG